MSTFVEAGGVEAGGVEAGGVEAGAAEGTAALPGRAAPDRRLGLGLLLFTTIAWGLAWPLMKFILGQLPPFTMRSLSGLLAAALMFPVAALAGEALLPPPGQWRNLLVQTALNFTFWVGFSSVSMLWLDASEAAIIAYSMPVWAALLAWPVLGERPTIRRVGALVIGLSGVLTLMATQPIAVSAAKLPGVASILAASVLFALGTVLTKRRPLAMPPIAGTAWQVLLGTMPLLPLALALDRPDLSHVTTGAWFGLLWLSVVSLGLAYVTWFRALRLVPATMATTFTLLVPVVGVLASAGWLGEPLGLRQILALGMTMAGVGLAVRA